MTSNQDQLEERDVIISVFASSAQAPTHKWAEKYFSNPPLIINLSNSQLFRSLARGWLHGEDLFSQAVNNPKIKIKRRGLVTFSAGWAFADELLQSQEELQKLDAYLLVDGCHTERLENWIKFAEKAANLEKLFILAHTEIKPPFISAQKTNEKIFNEASKLNEGSSAPMIETNLPEYLIGPKIEPITISIPAGTKKFTSDTLKKYESRGNLIKLHYSGETGMDHCYLAWHVQERMWRYLGEEWS